MTADTTSRTKSPNIGRAANILAHVRLLSSSSYAVTIEPNRVALTLKEPTFAIRKNFG
ncbi:MAG TPA: hypothetical protein VKZ79_23670 [Alphaproteobacteria bacterium]|nr:hypothetical protein [Alphaproteobacteria bacterium]